MDYTLSEDLPAKSHAWYHALPICHGLAQSGQDYQNLATDP